MQRKRSWTVSLVLGLLVGSGCAGDDPARDGGTAISDGSTTGVDGGPSVPACSGRLLDTDGVLDVDLRPVHLSGRVTVNGAPLPTVSASRGSLVFEERATQQTLRIPLGVSGEGHYDVWIPRGQYDLRFDGNEDLCTGGAISPMPCNEGLLRAFSGDEDGVLDLDIPMVKVSGAVTLRGSAMPAASAERGRLRFALTGSKETAPTQLFGAAGAASYRMSLLPGAYTVRWDGNEALCLSENAAVPCNEGPLLVRSLSSDGVLDIDVPMVEVSGAVTVEGAAMPSASKDRGRLLFALAEGDVLATKPFGSVGAASYRVALLPGSYTVRWDGNDALCDAGVVSPVPCNEGPLLARTLSANGVLDIDVPVVQLSGAITVRGAEPQPATGARGRLRFALTDGDAVPTALAPKSGPVSYRIALLPGDYAILWDGPESLCRSTSVSPVPCNDGVLSKRRLDADGVLDVDVPMVQVSGAVTVRDAPMPGAALERGRLGFSLDGGARYEADSFGASGAGHYQVSLLPGSYTIWWAGNAALCLGPTASAVPCNTGPLLDRGLSSDGVLDIDVPKVDVSGAVLLAGGALPATSSDRGALRFALNGGELVETAAFGASGAAAYALGILPGRYLVLLDGKEALCASGSDSFQTCMDQVLLGCP